MRAKKQEGVLSMTTEERIRAAVPEIVDWYSRSRRLLPWREEPGPYEIWISEIMLQQTRIEAVIPYYERFLRELPDVQALAEVEEDRLLKLWEGLGYYSRARNLKKAAQKIMTDFGGLLPRTAGELKSLPGIGDYTAGAIASIAYGEPAPAVDGNVLRVLSRLLRSGEDVAVPSVKARMTALLAGCYPSGEQAALLTEGLMELGETICIPNGTPRCELCPLRRLCLAREAGDPERYPVKTPKKARRIEERTILLLHCGDLWAIRRRERSGLLAGLWEFPNLDGCLEAREAVEAARELGLTVRAIRPAGQARHVFTHVEWHMTGYLLEVEAPNGDLLWKTAGQIAESYPLPTALKAYRALVLGI